MLTKKQTTTLVLFAQNYSLPIISKKMGVSLSTIRERIKALSKHHLIEFNNALNLRETYKRNKDAIKNTRVCSDFVFRGNFCTMLDWLSGESGKGDKIKDVF